MEKGISYFPFLVHLNDKMELIEAQYGLKGFAVIVKLWQKIYGSGYYCEWNDEVALMFARRCGVGVNVVSEILQSAIQRGIFDERLYKNYGILTSDGIQRRFFEIVKRRKSVDVKAEYLLISHTQIPQNVNILCKDVNKNQKNVYRNEQSKVKERKVNESITNTHNQTHNYVDNEISNYNKTGNFRNTYAKTTVRKNGFINYTDTNKVDYNRAAETALDKLLSGELSMEIAKDD